MKSVPTGRCSSHFGQECVSKDEYILQITVKYLCMPRFTLVAGSTGMSRIHHLGFEQDIEIMLGLNLSEPLRLLKSSYQAYVSSA